MTTEPAAYPGYATPTFRKFHDAWFVDADPWEHGIGIVEDSGPVGWTARTKGQVVGLFPDKQAAGEALVKHAGYEVLK
jgi:hypothetical protein